MSLNPRSLFPKDRVETLIWTEEGIASMVGTWRNIQAVTRDWKDRSGTPPVLQWGNNIEAVGAEMCVAKYLGVYWLPVVGDPSAPDINPNWPYEVRVNCSRDKTDMILRPQDKPKEHRVFISVLSYWPHFVILGWVYGRDWMIPDAPNWGTRGTNRPPCWWVAREQLQPLSTLPKPRRPMV